jgi:SAM-dependent methyltransferase
MTPLPPPDLESTNCPLCGSGSGIRRYAGAPFEPYGLIACADCGLQYLSPRPTESATSALYASDDYFGGGASGYSAYARQELALRATFRRLLQNLTQGHSTGGSLLEVGCGFGYLLDEARPFFARRVGTDFSASAVQIARRHADAVYHGDIDAVPPGPAFDCVIASQVIEHVHRPHQFIGTLLQRLRPGGCLLLATPDAGSPWRKLMGRRWPSFKVPEHLLYFDRGTLTRLMRDAGLREPALVAHPSAFPLPLVASKFHLRIPAFFDRFSLWIPGATLAMIGVKPDV